MVELKDSIVPTIASSMTVHLVQRFVPVCRLIIQLLQKHK